MAFHLSGAVVEIVGIVETSRGCVKSILSLVPLHNWMLLFAFALFKS